MSLRARAAVPVLGVCVLLASSGCALNSEADEPDQARPRPATGLSPVDPCALLTADELTERGAWVPGHPNNGITSEPGCDFDGDPFGYSFFKNQRMSVAKYGAQDNWAKFDRRELQGRPAANTIDASATKSRICSTMFDAGGGVIIVTAGELNDEGRDECAESWRLAELIAPRMPH
ncbi:hypothetical protein GCM10027271_29620 [Saccharopolyspora gloriosae]|uniref:DUF3558 domain-containing protein n=1 Tax=Saccharopolyspora gloriosae TaxID=455344 RepID=A0A840NPZ5_9PSEU|nr:DUF3558 family protein [Saccharopolyspora gloriosae]MBB5071202.1 hypothetical protein [Saccharopolyspora gloriosae]